MEALNKLRKVSPDADANYNRGYIDAMESILNLPLTIKNRMELERKPEFKELVLNMKNKQQEMEVEFN